MKRIEIVFKNYTKLSILTDRVRPFDGNLEIFDIEEHKMYFVNIDEIIYYTIKPVNYKEENYENN